MKHLCSKKNQKLNAADTEYIQELIQGNAKFFLQLGEGVFFLDRDGNYYILNQAGSAAVYKPEDMKNNGDSFVHTKYYHLDGEEMTIAGTVGARVLNGETIKNEIIRAVRPDKIQYFSASGSPIYNEEGIIIVAFICSRDITEIYIKKEFSMVDKGIITDLKDTTKNLATYEMIIKQREEILKYKKEKGALENEMKTKDDFLYLITHEFRTPMAVISSALQSMDLLYKKEITEKIDKYLKIIKQNNNRQLRLVNNLLDHIKISSGFVKLEYSMIDIVFITQVIINSVMPYANNKKVNLIFKPSIDSKIIYLDEEKYERVLLNLLSNAFKFTPEGKNITVSLNISKSNNNQALIVSVKDEGIGIPKDKHKLIFEQFGQADSDLSRSAQGTGLGLHLVKQIIEAQNGRICLESEEGVGSKFTFYLPIIDKGETICNESHTPDDGRITQAVSIELNDLYFD